ncbi:MAG TPA: Nramp family divalent metal transporter [Burkholderiales bacterium]|nr:Nramp family divalent metal transporter [Burkholderiales bacterium]
MTSATAASAGRGPAQAHFDPYALDPRDVLQPPGTLGAILRKIGPGIVLSASIVGSGELIATTTLGAKVGYTMLWLIILSCVIKSVVQSFLGRYTVARAETGLAAFDRIPGPRLKVNWVVWAWAAMVFVTLFQISAMFIGVSQAMNLVFSGVPVTAWVIIFFILTLILLLGGAYQRIEKLAMIKVGLFTLVTVLSAVVLTNMPEYFSWGDVAQGLTFEVPEAGLAIAVATFGITGVGATELYMYTYWCVEKGYARYTGPRENSDAWRARARGWVHVMNVDVVCSMLIYTAATIAFYLLGAGILHGMGKVPGGLDMIVVLSNIYTQTLGGWAKWLFYVGAIVILYGTIFAATAGHSRMCSDLLRLLGVFEHDDIRARNRYRDVFIVVLTVIPLIMYFLFGQAPVSMVTWGGIAQAATLPVIGFGTIYLTARHLPKEMKAPGWMTALLWVGAIVITAFVVPSLISEFRKLI